MIRRPPRSTQSRSSAASDVYKRQEQNVPYAEDGIKRKQRLQPWIAHAVRRLDVWDLAKMSLSAMASDVRHESRNKTARHRLAASRSARRRAHRGREQRRSP